MTNRTESTAIVGESEALLFALEQVSRVAKIDRPVLIVGERGTGKELFAARLHYLSGRWEQPYIAVNCAALPESLLESELFGHETGAFTGAAKRHQGRFELAQGGSLFLDEVASCSLRLQEKLLRVIEYGKFQRVGGREELQSEARIIAAANMDLPSLARKGLFREDLLDRLAFEVVTLPPLRERPEDIPLLAEHFGARLAAEVGADYFPGFTPLAMAALLAYAWPGNIRELKNAVERSYFRQANPKQPIADVAINPFASAWRLALPPAVTGNPPNTKRETECALPMQSTGSFHEAVAAFERDMLERALRDALHHQGRAAQALGLSYNQFRRELRKHGLLG